MNSWEVLTKKSMIDKENRDYLKEIFPGLTEKDFEYSNKLQVLRIKDEYLVAETVKWLRVITGQILSVRQTQDRELITIIGIEVGAFPSYYILQLCNDYVDISSDNAVLFKEITDKVKEIEKEEKPKEKDSTMVR